MAALPRFAAVSTSDEAVSILKEVVSALGLPAFVLVRYLAAGQAVLQLEHNLAGAVDLDAIVAQPVVSQLVSRPIPVLLAPGQLPHPDLQLGLGVASPHGEVSLVLLLGAEGEHIEPAVLMGRAGLACMVASALGDVLARVAPMVSPLSDREREVLALLIEGCSSKEGAAVLGISPRTFEKHAQRCRVRLGAETSMAAAVMALRRGWLVGALLTSRRQYGAG